MPSSPPSSPKIYVKACINGARTPDQHPNLPVTPEQLAAEAVAAHGAGAKAVHMHPKTADGVDSLLPEVVDAAVSAVRARGTGPAARGDDGVLGAAGRRRSGCAPSRAGRVLPDFASVNWHEPGSPDLAELLLSRGSASRSASSTPRRPSRGRPPTIAPHCMRVMIELRRRR